jgi:restriction system protein
MEIPKFNETFLPILEVLENGEILRGRDLLRIVEDRYYSDLPKEQLEQTTKSGDRLIENRIAWGKSYLKKGGFLHYPQRGFVQITEKGKTVKTDGL